MEFRDTVYCAAGKEKGKVYATATWGFEIDKWPRALESISASAGGKSNTKFGKPGAPGLVVIVTVPVGS
jgi:hypothetical protein